MKSLFAIAVILFAFTAGLAQNEQSPIVEKDITYKDWTLKSIRTGEDVTLRDLSRGKKLVIVVYYAPWCMNWRHDAPFLQRFYDKYKANGLEIVAVGEYDPLSSMKNNLEYLKLTFPAVYESENRTDKQKTQHYEYRRSTGDMRNWGSPWYILLEPAAFEKKGNTLVKRSNVINGEMIETEGEKFIREKLG
ncbi:MAG: redoxin domain-containing protein, partial [Pyrinomonadaceae bacterium]|nr:redoxin domain-containing protein [Pyrinomonadaceae bacterium]